MEKTPEISIVIPTYNQQDNLKQLYYEIRVSMDPPQMES
jgi:hypothetical protein